MTSQYQKLIPAAGLLIFAPHPDDDVLSSAVAIQRALAAQVPVHVVFLTSGESNPWPQRYVERKIIIRRADCLRWAQTRMQEARAALTSLGVPEQNIQFLGWPDLGITELLMSGADRPIDTLIEIIQRVKPGAIIGPALSDLHPDHSAAGVLLELARRRLADAGTSINWFWYLVHKPEYVERSVDIFTEASPQECAQKYRAIAEHKTQTALSAKRFLGFSEIPEAFFEASTPRGALFSVTLQEHQLQLSIKEPFAARLFTRRLLLRGERGAFEIRCKPGSLLQKEIACPNEIAASTVLFFKYEFRPVFRDFSGWAVLARP